MKEKEQKIHPQSHLTKYLTGGQFDVVRERIRVNSAEELAYLHRKEFLARTLGIKFYQTGIDIYGGLKISKDGLGREEAVLGMRSMNEPNKVYQSGFQIAEVEEYKDIMRREKDEH